MEKSELFINSDVFAVLLCSQLIFSSRSVVFDFNASLNDIAPASPMLLPVDLIRNEGVDCRFISFMCCIFLSSPFR